MPPLKIAVLHPPQADADSPFSTLLPVRDPARHLPGHAYENVTIAKGTTASQVARLAREGCDVAINLCDGERDEDLPGIDVIQALERAGLAFTGAGSAFYDPSRTATKLACDAAGIAVPAFAVVRDADDAADAAAGLEFPLIVKHPASYASLGLTRDSRVADAPALKRECARMIAAYGAALVEEFIEGPEFTVLVAEPRAGETRPRVFQPVVYAFPAGESFKHFDLKWHGYARMETRPVTDAALDARLRDVAARTFAAIRGTGYGRCDVRMDRAGRLCVLEINPNPDVFNPEGAYASADIVLESDPAGHRGFLEHLIECALRRRDRARPRVETRMDRARGFGLYALVAIAAGETVLAGEGEPHVLVTRAHRAADWEALRAGWLERYGWPLSPDVAVAWCRDPERWQPLRHSCDPNARLAGLDVVARRDIARGEPVTIDHATTHGPGMPAFECHCGSAACRGTIRGIAGTGRPA